MEWGAPKESDNAITSTRVNSSWNEIPLRLKLVEMCLKTFQHFAFMHVEAVWNVMFDPPCDIKCFSCCRAESVVAPAALICAVSVLKRAIISLFKIQLICTTSCSQAGQNLFFFQYWLHIKSISFLKNDSKLKLINFPTIWNDCKWLEMFFCNSNQAYYINSNQKYWLVPAQQILLGVCRDVTVTQHVEGQE